MVISGANVHGLWCTYKFCGCEFHAVVAILIKFFYLEKKIISEKQAFNPDPPVTGRLHNTFGPTCSKGGQHHSLDTCEVMKCVSHRTADVKSSEL